MPELKLTVTTLRDLPAAARQLLSFAGERRVFAFFAEMGAGKTTFIKTICAALGVCEIVTSPTFAIVNEYADVKDKPIYHFDFYRIEDSKEAVDIGCEEYFYSGNYCFVEWAEKVLYLLPEDFVRVTMTLENESRQITFQYD